MEIISVTKDNIEKEHICCAISNNNDCQVRSKKEWMKKRFEDGLVFKKFDVRGKCFIEYVPAEKAWTPICADGYMYIDCLWVSGQFKGHGYSSLLLNECIEDSKAKGKKGLVILSSDKKKGFIADKKYLIYKGFQVCDSCDYGYELMYLPFEKDAAKPQFKEQVKDLSIDEKGFVIYHADQCPYTAKYVPLLAKTAEEKGAAIKTIHITTVEQAQAAPMPYTSFGLFYNGTFITNEILSEKKFAKLIDEMQK